MAPAELAVPSAATAPLTHVIRYITSGHRGGGIARWRTTAHLLPLPDGMPLTSGPLFLANRRKPRPDTPPRVTLHLPAERTDAPRL